MKATADIYTRDWDHRILRWSSAKPCEMHNGYWEVVLKPVADKSIWELREAMVILHTPVKWITVRLDGINF